MPLKFKKLLGIPNKISQVVLLGNCTKSYEFLKFVNEISSNVTFVRGEFDNEQLPTTRKNINKQGIPMDTVIKQGDFKIGCCSGYTVVPKNDPLSLLALARQLDVDILLWGGTHNVEAYTLEGKFFVNPGSCTGAFNTDWPILGQEEPARTKASPSPKDGGDEQDKSNEQTGRNEPADNREEDGNNSSENVAQSDSFADKTSEDGSQKKNQDASGKIDLEKVNDEDEDEHEDENEELDIPDLELDGSNDPSFCLFDIQGSTCALYIYIYVDGEVKVDKVVYKKSN